MDHQALAQTLRLYHPVDSGETSLLVILTGGIAHHNLGAVVAVATLTDMVISVDEIEMIILNMRDVAVLHHTDVDLRHGIERAVAIQDHIRPATGIRMNVIQSEDG
jgi:hypothetical protein